MHKFSLSLQGHGWHQHEGEVHHVTFPFVDETDGKGDTIFKETLFFCNFIMYRMSYKRKQIHGRFWNIKHLLLF